MSQEPRPTPRGCELFPGRRALKPGTVAELSRLRAALPGYDVTVASRWPDDRFEAVRRGDGPGPWCVISTDPADLWRELRPRVRSGTDPASGTAQSGPAGRLLPFDTAKPNIARAYDYLLGGKDHFSADRELAERLLAIYPPVRQLVQESRRFLRRAVRYVAGRGITQYLDLGAGLPTSPAVHETARTREDHAAVCYVDNDAMVIAHIRALVEKADERVRAVPGDLAAPAAVLSAPELAGFLDLTRPVCVILSLVLHFLPAPAAREVVSGYVAALAPGSYVIISVGRGGGELGEQVTETYDAAPLYNHSAEDIAAFFDGLDLVQPGISEAHAWRPGLPRPPVIGGRAGQILAGVGRKP